MKKKKRLRKAFFALLVALTLLTLWPFAESAADRLERLDGVIIASGTLLDQPETAVGSAITIRKQASVIPATAKRALAWEEASRAARIAPSSEQKVVYLTFDDGPTANSGELLDVLDVYGIKATFFMLDGNVRRYPEAVQRMAESGHQLGMHSVTHKVKLVYANADSVVAEMRQGQDGIREITGIHTALFRPPYGSNPHMTQAYRQACAEAGLIMWDWNVDSLDWKFRSADYVDYTLRQVAKLESKNVTPVILLHDRPETIWYLWRLLDQLIAKGYHFAIITEDVPPVQFPVPAS